MQGMGIFFLFMPLAQTPGPDLAYQDAVMEGEAFVSSEDSWISTSRRARAGWNPKHSFQYFRLDTMKAIASCTNYVAPGQALA